MNKKGFTILELLGAILVISIGVLTAYGVVQRILTYTIDSSDRITAAYLAKEGVEIVRNIRDTNWINNRDFDFGLIDASCLLGYWEIEYDKLNLNCCSSCDGTNDFNDLRFFKTDFSGYYSYSFGGRDSKFKRKITITSIAANELKIVVEVLWSKRGQAHNITVQENIYDWK